MHTLAGCRKVLILKSLSPYSFQGSSSISLALQVNARTAAKLRQPPSQAVPQVMSKAYTLPSAAAQALGCAAFLDSFPAHTGASRYRGFSAIRATA